MLEAYLPFLARLALDTPEEDARLPTSLGENERGVRSSLNKTLPFLNDNGLRRYAAKPIVVRDLRFSASPRNQTPNEEHDECANNGPQPGHGAEETVVSALYTKQTREPSADHRADQPENQGSDPAATLLARQNELSDCASDEPENDERNPTHEGLRMYRVLPPKVGGASSVFHYPRVRGKPFPRVKSITRITNFVLASE